MIKIVAPKKPFNEYKICDDYAIIYLLKNTGEIFECLVDLDDLDRLIKFNRCWFTSLDNKQGLLYVKTNTSYYNEHGKYKQTSLYMHKYLLNYQGKAKYINHKNHNTLDNRKNNLVITEHTNNSTDRKGANKNNKTGVRNVSYIKRDNVYWVQFMKKGKRYKWEFPGDQFEEACDFAEKKRKELFGEFAGNSIRK